MDNPLKIVDGISIFVTSEGKFLANIEGKNVKRASLKAIEKLIAETRQAITLTLVTDNYRGHSIRQVQVKAFEGRRRVRLKDGELRTYYNDAYFLATPEQIREMEELAAEEDKLYEKWERLRDKVQQVNESNFERIQKQIQEGKLP